MLPFQPEKETMYVGSFYAFAIWIGIGVLGVFEYLSKKLNHKTSAIISLVLCLFASPGLMASENWDDHDRSGRYTARE